MPGFGSENTAILLKEPNWQYQQKLQKGLGARKEKEVVGLRYCENLMWYVALSNK